MRRTQLYLDDNLWDALHVRARAQKTTVSELVREAIRERYFGNHGQRMKAMQAFVGIRKDSADKTDSVEYIQQLRKSDRIDELYKA
jgi:Ribbon-helix-helix protein, copG family